MADLTVDSVVHKLFNRLSDIVSAQEHWRTSSGGGWQKFRKANSQRWRRNRIRFDELSDRVSALEAKLDE